jgi:hypothetical protein
VAIIGASNTPGKVGHDIFANILQGGFQGTLYPVNPNAKAILSVKTFPAITAISDSVDLAIIILPPKACVKAVEEAIEKGVKGIVIVSAGSFCLTPGRRCLIIRPPPLNNRRGWASCMLQPPLRKWGQRYSGRFACPYTIDK